MNDKVILRAVNLTKDYGKKENKFRALDNISLEINRGESVAIVGKSGSGKSTLMHLLALLDQPTSGKVLVSGENFAKNSRGGKLKNSRKLGKIRNKTFGFVFQQFFMNGRDSVLKNVELPLKIAGVSSRKRRKIALEALEIVELADKAKNRANDLSGGQKQRVCVARAIVNNPEIIFADEPTGNLDSATGEKVERLLFDFAKKGKTLVIVTHDSELAAKCDRQIHIRDGHVVDEIRENQKGDKR
jgi:putative ABC transport system ATP-binding protein